MWRSHVRSSSGTLLIRCPLFQVAFLHAHMCCCSGMRAPPCTVRTIPSLPRLVVPGVSGCWATAYLPWGLDWIGVANWIGLDWIGLE